MEKIKVDVLIDGSLICEQKIMGGGRIYSLHNAEDCFDVSKAIVIKGNIDIDSLDSKDYVIAVTNSISTKGGDYGK